MNYCTKWKQKWKLKSHNVNTDYKKKKIKVIHQGLLFLKAQKTAKFQRMLYTQHLTLPCTAVLFPTRNVNFNAVIQHKHYTIYIFIIVKLQIAPLFLPLLWFAFHKYSFLFSSPESSEKGYDLMIEGLQHDSVVDFDSHDNI